MPPPPPPSPPPSGSPIDRRIWRACAGSNVHIPTVNSRVCYFPQGHIEQISNGSNVPFVSSLPLIPCHVSSVQFLADPVTDEVFTKLLLDPSPVLNHNCENLMDSGGCDFDDGINKVVTFAKILTPSDANNGGGFSVPRFCADSIFPQLNYQAEPPVQTLKVTDVHGGTWEFRHIYRGTPRRHLLTTGWSKFVNHKKLIAGDSVVFMRDSVGKMFIGVRRAVRSSKNGSDSGGYARWREQIGCGGEDLKVKVNEDGFSRGGGRGRVSPEAVIEAVEKAAQGLPFEVVYYPRAGWFSDFVVRADEVQRSLNLAWQGGMKVKMAMETEDSSRMTWFQGTIASVYIPDCGPWRGSPWGMLQVTWDEPEALQNAKRVSPWQVEVVSPSPPVHVAFPPAKKFRASEFTDKEGHLLFPMSGIPNSSMGNMTHLLNSHTFPAGLQGARQNPFSVHGLFNFLSQNTSERCTNSVFDNSVVPVVKTVSTELNIGSSASENLSPDSQSSIHSCGTDLVGNYDSTKVESSSFLLFGVVIPTKQTVKSGCVDVGCMENYVNKEWNDNNSVDVGLSSLTELMNRNDAHYPRASAVEACLL